MTFVEKIDKIKTVSKLSLKKLAEKSGLYTTLEKAYSENRDMKETTAEKFLQNLSINPVWWATGKGEVFLPKIEVSTRVDDPPAKYDTVEDLRKMIAAHEKTISIMEKMDEMKDRVLNEYREQLEECRQKLDKVKQSH